MSTSTHQIGTTLTDAEIKKVLLLDETEILLTASSLSDEEKQTFQDTINRLSNIFKRLDADEQSQISAQVKRRNIRIRESANESGEPDRETIMKIQAAFQSVVRSIAADKVLHDIQGRMTQLSALTLLLTGTATVGNHFVGKAYPGASGQMTVASCVAMLANAAYFLAASRAIQSTYRAETTGPHQPGRNGQGDATSGPEGEEQPHPHNE